MFELKWHVCNRQKVRSIHILKFVDVHAYVRILMTVAYKFASYKLLALLIPLLCALIDNLDLYDQPWEFIEMSSKSAL